MTDADWMEASVGYGQAITRYYEKLGRSADDPAVISTIRTNTELVPQRAGNLLRLLGELTSRPSLENAAVAELGCGFGALAGYLAWSQWPQRLLAIDSRSEYVAAAAASSRSLDVGPVLEFRVDDMKKLETLGDGEFDILLVNNAFIYLTEKREMVQAVRQFRRVLAAGGYVLLYHANRWTWRDPFTHSPLVHLMPAFAAAATCRVTGWQHSHDRVRLVSAPALARMLRAAGFDQVVAATVEDGMVRQNSKLRGKPFYALAGRVPA